MPSFSQRSRRKLATCHPRLITLMTEVVARHDIKILEGFRSVARQDHLFETGFSRVRGGKSPHNTKPSRAVDLVFWPFKSPEDWTNLERWRETIGYIRGTCDQMQKDGRLDASFKLISGSDWDNDPSTPHSFYDFPHWEIRELAEG